MEQVLWSATVRREATARERIHAAAAAGFGAVSLYHQDFAALDFDRGKARDLCALAQDLGVRLPVMDGSTAWYPVDESRPLRSEPVAFEAAIRAAEAFDCAKVCAVPGFPTRADIPGLAGHFAAACDTARDRGLLVQLEFGPVPPVKGLAQGWDIVRLADRRNGALVFDTWHFFRSDAAFDLLEAIPGDRITAVQLSDGAAEIRESVIKDTFLHRLLPGDGVFDLQRVVRILASTGGLADVGPEVLSREIHALDPERAAALARERVERLLQQSGLPAAAG
jgi:sugar phosphate isomerase/epimerase